MADIEKVASMASMKQPEKGQHIYFPDDPSTSIYFLKKGKVIQDLGGKIDIVVLHIGLDLKLLIIKSSY